MTFRRFGSWPSFNGKKVVLEDDTRLNASVPTIVPAGMLWRIGINNQAVAAVHIQVDGTVVVDGTLVMM